jgi:hypothetical protein
MESVAAPSSGSSLRGLAGSHIVDVAHLIADGVRAGQTGHVGAEVHHEPVPAVVPPRPQVGDVGDE